MILDPDMFDSEEELEAAQEAAERGIHPIGSPDYEVE